MLKGSLVLLLLMATAYAVWYWRASSALDAEIAKIRERGEPVWFSECRPDPLPPEVDGTAELLAAIDRMVPIEGELREELDNFMTIQSGEPQEQLDEDDEEDRIEPRDPDEMFRDLRQLIKDNAPAFKSLGAALAKGRCRLPIDYDDPVPMIANHAGSECLGSP